MSGRDIDKLHVQSGDVVVIRVPPPVDYDIMKEYEREADAVRNHLYANDIDDVLILLTHAEGSLKSYDDDSMAEAGWARIGLLEDLVDAVSLGDPLESQAFDRARKLLANKAPSNPPNGTDALTDEPTSSPGN